MYTLGGGNSLLGILCMLMPRLIPLLTLTLVCTLYEVCTPKGSNLPSWRVYVCYFGPCITQPTNALFSYHLWVAQPTSRERMMRYKWPVIHLLELVISQNWLAYGRKRNMDDLIRHGWKFVMSDDNLLLLDERPFMDVQVGMYAGSIHWSCWKESW